MGLAEIPSDGPLSYKRIRLGRFRNSDEAILRLNLYQNPNYAPRELTAHAVTSPVHAFACVC